jgi:hypothetical protein
MKRKFTFFYLLIFVAFIVAGSIRVSAQTVNTTVTYTGFQACGGCTVCGADYWCFNTPAGNYCGPATNACGTNSFMDPVPAGNIVTHIDLQYWSAHCSGGSIDVNIDGNPFPTVYETSTGCLCSNFPCAMTGSSTATYPCGIAGYNYGGANSLTLCTGASVCMQRIDITITYAPASESTPAGPAGAISGITPLCVGSTQTYSIAAVTGAATYTWTVPAGWTILSGQGSTSISVEAGSSAGDICVTPSNLCGAGAAACYAVSSNPLPVAPTSATVNHNNFCQGAFSTITLIGNGGSGTTMDWYTGSCGGVFVGSGTSLTIATPASSPTTYYTDWTNGCGTTGCANVTVNVNALPTPSITGASSICAGNTATLDAGGGYSGYLWNTGASSQTIPVTTTGTYTVTVTSAAGCAGTASANVLVTSSLAPTITGPTTICSGGNVTLDAGSPYSTYLWSTTASSETISVATPGTYSVTVTNASGCTGSTSVTINTSPSLTPTISGSPSFCPGSSTTLDAGSGYSSYLWSNSITTEAISVGTAGTYTVTVTNSSGCTGSTSVTVNTASGLSPTITGPASLCSGSTTTLDAGSGYSSYLWSNLATSETITVTATGTYSVTVTNFSGCSGTASVAVTLSSNLSPTISGSPSICSGSSSTLDAGSGFSSYLWSNLATSETILVNTAGTYSVTVTNASGCTGTANITIAINNNPTIDVSPAVAICIGSSTNLNVSGTGTSYAWSPTSSLNDSLIPNPVATPTTSTTYIVTATNGGNCTATASIPVTVNPLPNVYNVAGGGTYCSSVGGPISLSGSDINTNYQLQVGGVNIGPSVPGTGGTINFGNQTVSGTYVVIATNTITNCQNTMSGTAIFTINPSPMAYNIVGGGSYCIGDTSGVTVGLSGSDIGVSYQLQNGGSNIGLPLSGTGSAITFGNQMAAGTYTIVATNIASSCQTTMTGTVTITVNSVPVAFAGHDTTICNGIIVPLVASGGTFYAWSNGPSSASNIVKPSSTTTYTVTVSNGTDCSATSNVVITVKPFTPPNIAALGPMGFCSGSTNPAVLVASGGYSSYLWSTGATTQTISVNTIGTYWVIGTTANGCSDTSSSAVLYNFPAPNTPVIKANGDTVFCEGDTITVDLYTTTPYYTYHWVGGSVTPVIDVTHAGNYNVTVTDSNGCSAVSNTIPVTFLPKPVAYFDYGASGTFVNFYDTSYFGQSYMWQFGDGGTSTAKDTSHKYNGPGQYTVTLIVTNMCGSDSQTVVINLVSGQGIEETTFMNNLSVYPIPTNGNLEVAFDYSELNALEIKIFNLMGQNLYTETINNLSGKYHNIINMSQLSNGVYMLQISSDKRSVNIKIVKD